MNSLAWASALIGLLLAGLLAGCSIGPLTMEETLAQGPFEIVASGRRISAGGFPNPSANPFASTEVISFGVRGRGQAIAVGGESRFWRVAAAFDAELATGRLDRMFRAGEP